MSAADPIRILLVDDNPADAMLARELLMETKIPASVTVVTDGECAINLIDEILSSKARMPELVLLDLNMPKRGGHEVLRLLRGMPEIMTMLIVIYTGSRSPHDLEAARNGGASGYIVKPIDATRVALAQGTGSFDPTTIAAIGMLDLVRGADVHAGSRRRRPEREVDHLRGEDESGQEAEQRHDAVVGLARKPAAGHDE